MKFAWIENGRVRDVCHGNPAECYHPDVAKLYTEEVPDDAANGDEWDGTTLTKPAPPAPMAAAPEVIPPKVSPVEFKLLFTPQERVAIKAARQSDAVIQDFYEIVEDPRLTHVDLGLASTQAAIGYLQSKALLTAERAAAILAGTQV